MKILIGLSLVSLGLASSGLAQHRVEKVDSTLRQLGKVVADSVLAKDLITDSLINQILLSDSAIIVSDDQETDSIITFGEDVFTNDTLSCDSVGMDSMAVRLKNLGVDSLAIDTLSLDTLLLDSLAIDTLSLDTLTKDTVVSDTLKTSRMKVKKGAPAYQPHPCVLKFANFVWRFHREYREMLNRWDDIYITDAPSWIRSDADYYKLIIPTTYYSAAIEDAFSIEEWKPTIPFVREKQMEKLMPTLPRLTKSEDIDKQINKQLLTFYLDYPNMVCKNEKDIEGADPLSDKYIIHEPKKEKVLHLAQTNVDVNQVQENDLLVIKPNFWTMGGNGFVQFSQNYVSDNWYKGGESTKSLLSGMVWQVNYDDKQRVQFENRIEMKLGFIATPSDTVHQYKPNNDLFRVTTKVGYKAIKNWYYTLSAEFKTQFASSYETNSKKLISTFLSPAELNVGLGMDYKFVKDGICNLSVLINPFNYTLYSVSSDRVDPTKFNIDEGHKTKSQWGSRLDAKLSWKIMSNLLWESKLSYTTNYDKALSEWENTFTFNFNRYFSTKLFMHARFDDSVNREPNESYFQFQELLSLGFNYVW